MRSAIKGLQFIGDRITYITLRGRWCDIVLNVHAPSENKVTIRRTAFTTN